MRDIRIKALDEYCQDHVPKRWRKRYPANTLLLYTSHIIHVQYKKYSPQDQSANLQLSKRCFDVHFKLQKSSSNNIFVSSDQTALMETYFHLWGLFRDGTISWEADPWQTWSVSTWTRAKTWAIDVTWFQMKKTKDSWMRYSACIFSRGLATL